MVKKNYLDGIILCKQKYYQDIMVNVLLYHLNIIKNIEMNINLMYYHKILKEQCGL